MFSFKVCLIFLCAFSFSPKSVSSHHRTNTDHVGVLNSLNQISSKWMLNSGQNWCEMEICDQQCFQKQHAQHWVLFRCQIKMPNLNSSKLIMTRWILHQHNINAITTYFKYLILQSNSMLEEDLILQLATLWVKEHLGPCPEIV